MKFSGTVGDGWDYVLVLATDNSDGNVFAEDVIISHDLGDGWNMHAGVFKLPFARQELISSSRQVAVDRGLTTEFFTLNRAEQVQFTYDDDQMKFRIALSDGGNSGFTTLPGGASNDFALTVRGDVRLDGEWADAKDEFGSDDNALFVGGAVHYEKFEGNAAVDDNLVWTIDALWKSGGFGVTAALFGSSVSNNTPTSDLDQFGAYAQVSYIVDEKWDVFARWDYIDDDGAGGDSDDTINAITVGLNHHFNANVKFTTDIVYVFGDDPESNPSGDAINGSALARPRPAVRRHRRRRPDRLACSAPAPVLRQKPADTASKCESARRGANAPRLVFYEPPHPPQTHTSQTV